jgi:VanZ family protein
MRRIKFKCINILLCLFWMSFIFYMSSNNGEISHEESIKIVNYIQNNIVPKNPAPSENTVSEQQVKVNESTDNAAVKNPVMNENNVNNSQAKVSKSPSNAAGENSVKNENTIKEQQLNEGQLDHIVRKNAHAFMYMVLAILASSAFFSYNKRGKNTIVYILFICLFYAVTDEFHQSFVPERTSLVSDVLVDFCGALIGLLFFYIVYYKVYEIYKIKRKKIKS